MVLTPSIGELSQRVTHQQAIRTADTSGQMLENWVDAGSYYAEVIGTGGDEYIRGQQVEAGIVSLIRIRYPHTGPIPTALDRVIVDGNRTLNIVRALDRDGRKKEYWLHCRELDGGQA